MKSAIALAAAIGSTALRSLEFPVLTSYRKPGNRRSQATVRRAVRRRSNLPKAMQKRLGFKCH